MEYEKIHKNLKKFRAILIQYTEPLRVEYFKYGYYF